MVEWRVRIKHPFCVGVGVLIFVLCVSLISRSKQQAFPVYNRNFVDRHVQLVKHVSSQVPKQPLILLTQTCVGLSTLNTLEMCASREKILEETGLDIQEMRDRLQTRLHKVGKHLNLNTNSLRNATQ